MTRSTLRQGVVAAVAASVALSAFSASAAGDPGDLDPAWSTDGLLIGEDPLTGEAADIRADGTLAIAGGTPSGWLHVMSLDSAGQPDLQFGFEGSVQLPSCRPAAELVLASDESIFALSPDCLVKLTPQGTLDQSFSNDGVVGLHLARDFALDQDERILVAQTENDLSGVAVTRIEETGRVDLNFGDEGTALLDLGSYEGVALDTVGSEAVVAALDSGELAVFRLDQMGTPDELWGADGLATLDTDNVIAIGDVTALESGAVAVTGPYGFDYSLSYAARFDSTGDPDATFSGDGIETFNLPGFDDEHSLAAQEDGKLLMAGHWSYFCPGSAGPFCMWQRNTTLVRLTTAGQLDPTFGTGGFLALDIDGFDQGNEVIVDDETAYVVGSAQGRCCNREQELPHHILVARHLLEDSGSDFDADGVSVDECPTRFAQTDNGCPSYARTIEIDSKRVNRRSLKVELHLESQAEACVVPANTRLERKKKGHWIEIAEGNPIGTDYEIKRPGRGPFRVVLPAEKTEDVGRCLPAPPVKL